MIKFLSERKLTDKEKTSLESYIHALKKNRESFDKKYGADAKSVMYAIATKQAKETNESATSQQSARVAADATSVDHISIDAKKKHYSIPMQHRVQIILNMLHSIKGK